jgi:hypothetical protein
MSTTPLPERTATTFPSKRNSQMSPVSVIDPLAVDRSGSNG